jgi:FtsP/CotA-like multicopper oxidase with cupredoxin domain
VLVDFSSLAVGDLVVLRNFGPDEPFAGLHAPEAQAAADPETTGQVLQFRVVAPTGQGQPGAVPATLPAIAPLTTTLPPRDLTLNESMYEAADIPIAALLGTAAGGPRHWHDAITETPTVDTTEIWRITNLTVDAHPIHLHLVHFQVLDRTPVDVEAYHEAQEQHLSGGGPTPMVEDFVSGPAIAPEPWEAGWKETVIANPAEVTRIIATFDLTGRYVWHCHLLEHEDNDMMRPFEVVAR